MKNQPYKFFTYLIIIIVLTLGLSLSFQSLLAAWQAPTSAPPDGNVNPPIYNGSPNPDTEALVGMPLAVDGNFLVGIDALKVIESSGNVGIGEMDPKTKLEVNSDGLILDYDTDLNFDGEMDGVANFIGSDSYINIIGEDNSSNSGGIKFIQVNSSGKYQRLWHITQRAKGASEIEKYGLAFAYKAGTGSPDNYWYTANSIKMIITPSGNVGIGTINPTEKLYVNGNIRVAAENDICIAGGNCLSSAGGGGGTSIEQGDTKVEVSDSGNGNIVFTDDGTEIARITNGNVGIGEINPHSRLQVRSSDSPDLNYDSDDGELNGDVSFASENVSLNLIGVDDSANSGALKFLQVDSSGNYERLWYITQRAGGSEALESEKYGLAFGYKNGTTGHHWFYEEWLKMIITPSGKVGIGTLNPSYTLHVSGNCGGGGSCDSDIAEIFPKIPEEKLEPGDVVVLDGNDKFNLHKSSLPFDTRVAGVYSTDPGILIAGEGGIAIATGKQDKSDYTDDKLPLALAGQVPVKVSCENGPIDKGDLLTTSSAPGRAMKCNIDTNEGKLKCLNAVLGKAMEPCAQGDCTIIVLVTLQ